MKSFFTAPHRCRPLQRPHKAHDCRVFPPGLCPPGASQGTQNLLPGSQVPQPPPPQWGQRLRFFLSPGASSVLRDGEARPADSCPLLCLLQVHGAAALSRGVPAVPESGVPECPTESCGAACALCGFGKTLKVFPAEAGPAIPALQEAGQEDCKLKASLGDSVTWWDPVSNERERDTQTDNDVAQ